MTDSDYTFLKQKILKLTKIDLDCYKSQQMRRRLTFLVEKTHNTDTVAYCKLIETDAEQLNKLKNFLTINVTEFFRDEWAYKELRNNILPVLVSNNTLKIWSAGCSNGGEPFSIAILIKELSSNISPDIIATDIDEFSLLKASAGGPYNTDSIKSIPKELLSRYFILEDDNYWLRNNIIKMVKFKQHNLLTDKFDSGFDLICCRNVTIYFTQETKTKLNEKFWNAINDNGILFIGATEFMTNPREFGFVKLGSCFYKKIRTSVSVNPHKKQTELQKV